MKKNSTFVKTLIVSLLVVVHACDGEDLPVATIDPREESVELDTSRYSASNLSVEDIGNTGNASDILVTFRSAIYRDSILSYSLVITSTDQAIEVPDSTAILVTPAVFGKSKYEIRLPEDHHDAGGSLIEENVVYVASVSTVGIHMSDTIHTTSFSEEFSIAQTIDVSTFHQNAGANDGVSVDVDGNLYIADYGGYNASTYTGTGTEIIKITRDGDPEVFASGLVGPAGTVVGSNGSVYVTSGSNYTNGDLLEISQSGKVTKLATIEGYPSGIALDSIGNLYIANYYAPTVHKVDVTGNITILAQDSRLLGGIGIAVDELGNVLVGNGISGEILSIDSNGELSSIGFVPTVVANSVIGYITYFEGHIYATGVRANKIYRISKDGKVEEYAGSGSPSSNDGALMSASFNGPNGITVDTEKRILYVSQRNGIVRIVPID
ncbi:MAG: hypothetical protein AAF789_07810 [Bacteroidota bacterium]